MLASYCVAIDAGQFHSFSFLVLSVMKVGQDESCKRQLCSSKMAWSHKDPNSSKHNGQASIPAQDVHRHFASAVAS